jgi:hypothetical protein
LIDLDNLKAEEMIDIKNNSFSTKRITNSPTFSIEDMLDQA